MIRKIRLIVLIIVCFMLCSSVVGGVFALYVQSDSKTVTIGTSNVFSPVNGGYYLVGSFCEWAVNENAVYLNDAVSGGVTAQKANVQLVQGATCKVVQYGASVSWLTWQSGLFMQSDNYMVQATGGYNVSVTGSTPTISIAPNSDFIATEGTYYLIGTFTDWALNSFAIPLNDACSNEDKATELNVSLVQYSQCRVVKKTAVGFDWIAWSGVTLVGDNYQVPTAGAYNVYVNKYNNGWIGGAS